MNKFQRKNELLLQHKAWVGNMYVFLLLLHTRSSTGRMHAATIVQSVALHWQCTVHHFDRRLVKPTL